MRTARSAGLWAVVVVAAATVGGCSSEKYARYEPYEDGRGGEHRLSNTGKAVLGGATMVAIEGAWLYFMSWLEHAGHEHSGHGGGRHRH